MKEVKIIFVNGTPKSGKTTFEEYCKKFIPNKKYCGIYDFRDNYIENYSYADIGYEIISNNLKYDGDRVDGKTDEVRNLLSCIVEYYENNHNGCTNDICAKIFNNIVKKYEDIENNMFFFIDCRNFNNILKFKKHFDSQWNYYYKPYVECFKNLEYTIDTVYIINNNTSKKNYNNHGDNQATIRDNDYDEFILNDGTLEELEEKAKEFMNKILQVGVENG